MNRRELGAGEALIMVHGFAGGSGYWSPVAESFAEQFHVVMPDLLGFAGSTTIPVPETVQGFAAGLIKIMDKLAIEQCSLLGHSMGGMIALQAALDAPSRISRLVLHGTSCQAVIPDRYETLDETIARFETEGIDATIDRVVASWFVDYEMSPAYAACRAAAVGLTATTAIAAMTTMRPWNVCDRMSEIGVPTLVIGGDKDRSIPPQHFLNLWHGIPDSHLAVLPNCAHAVHLEEPALFTRFVGEFLSTGNVG